MNCKRGKLPPLLTDSSGSISKNTAILSLNNVSVVSSDRHKEDSLTPDIPRMLTFEEYRQWLHNRRDIHLNDAPTSMSIKQKVRCKTATLRKILPRSSSVCPELDTMKTPSSAPLPTGKAFNQTSIGRKLNPQNNDAGIFDMSSMSTILPQKSKSLIRLVLNRNPKRIEPIH